MNAAVLSMPNPKLFRRAAYGLALWCGLASTPVLGQDSLTRARALYLAADYEQTLEVLGQFSGGAAPEQLEIAAYRVFCLVALGRTEEATRAIESMVAADPFYQPPETLASPRIRKVFGDTRRAALPTIARREYATAKAAFDRKDPGSTALFERLLTLLADPDLEGPESADLRTLADGFRELSLAFHVPEPVAIEPLRAAAPPVPQAPGPSVGSSPAPVSAPAREGDPGVTPPVTLSQALPLWIPPSRGTDRQQQFDGILEVLIDQRGLVTTATLRASVHPQYDAELLKLARSWKFKAATKDGVPVPYLKVVRIRLRPSGD